MNLLDLDHNQVLYTSALTDRQTDRPTDQSTNQPINQPTEIMVQRKVTLQIKQTRSDMREAEIR